VWFFAELLDLESVRALEREPAHAPRVALLRLFAHGTYADYKRGPQPRPQLSPAQLWKLKCLSLASLAAQKRRWAFAEVAAQLDLPEAAAAGGGGGSGGGGGEGAGADAGSVEDLFVAACYAGLVAGKLDQRTRTLEVSWAAGRDVQAADLAALGDKLARWIAAVERARRGVEAQLERVHAAERADERSSADAMRRVEEEARRLQLEQRAGGAGEGSQRQHGVGANADADADADMGVGDPADADEPQARPAKMRVMATGGGGGH